VAPRAGNVPGIPRAALLDLLAASEEPLFSTEILVQMEKDWSNVPGPSLPRRLAGELFRLKKLGKINAEGSGRKTKYSAKR
jgi:hypothetical protein